MNLVRQTELQALDKTEPWTRIRLQPISGTCWFTLMTLRGFMSLFV